MPELDSPVLLDTDVLSLIMKGRLDPADSALVDHTWCVSFVTVAELAKGIVMAGWGLRQWNDLSDWLRELVILPYDLRVSYVWGQLAGQTQSKGRPRPINDMWIAAVALANGVPLATRNVKDYADFADHHGLVLLPN